MCMLEILWLNVAREMERGQQPPSNRREPPAMDAANPAAGDAVAQAWKRVRDGRRKFGRLLLEFGHALRHGAFGRAAPENSGATVQGRKST